MQRIGSAVGIAVIGSVLFGALTTRSQQRPRRSRMLKKHGSGGAEAVKTAITEIAQHNVAVGFAHSAATAPRRAQPLPVAFFLVFTLPKRISLTGRASSGPAGLPAAGPAGPAGSAGSGRPAPAGEQPTTLCGKPAAH
jgi:hypothetical protein